MVTVPGREPNSSASELDRAQCMELLGGARIARVVLSVGCIPVALPVNMSVLGENVIFATDSRSKLTSSVYGQVVSLETDDIDLVSRTGWSVLVTGIALPIAEPLEIEWAGSRLQAWAAGPHPLLVKVQTTLISGRKLRWDAPASAGDRYDD
jgi:hypothetical protein